MSRIATVLGRGDDAARYAELADRVRAAWQAEYTAADGRLTPDTQANHVRALAFELVPTELRPAVADRLVDLIRDADTHLATGFLATPYLLSALADAGHLDVAYELLLQDTEPSWLVMVDRGATTVWERWNGVSSDGVPIESLNHYSKGAVISFLHRYTAGIELLDDGPAYRHFRVRPRPGGGLTWAEAAHDSPYGRIESAWRMDGERLRAARCRARRHAGRGRPARRPRPQRPIRASTPTAAPLRMNSGGCTMTDREIAEWAGPAWFLPPVEPPVGTTAPCTFRASPTPRRRGTGRCSSTSGCRPAVAGAAGRVDPRRRLHVRRPPLPAGDVAAEPDFDALLDTGLAVATIDYRHALEAPFPAQLHDAKAAVRYLRAFADELGISTERIGVMGESAGGHIAALVGLTAHRPDLEGTPRRRRAVQRRRRRRRLVRPGRPRHHAATHSAAAHRGQASARAAR